MYTQAIERNISDRVHGEVDNVVAEDETRVHDAFLTAVESLVVPRVEVAMKSINASSGRDPESVVLDPGLRVFGKYRRPTNDRPK